ncbi:type IX secretion system membrane protein PorP/SprF [Flavobacterium sp. FlaQc-52]|jgi:type IX secretion system PorP/SprF family membrane protein|uniref:Type IX secretion system membrane protein PorP/SprF n=1 Tax=Flavobacterium cupriresistens TaxID=2893885 RepID=A0ABU4RF77_9FLAO|nr:MULTISPECIES: type IX secretion system membrane protein PorP/SprF [unclassified Flavobacterium]MDX6191256.1 type IX secretion system membrane protein PorP/SprF [Flavobacterium sp. Fl-318]UFH42425.1 type IX secretion system membrane protein PorP/SprF [Flavobacterium sp. F-323]
MVRRYNQIIAILMLFIANFMYGQQDPQYTQYMYNTLSVNSAYAGSAGHLTITGIYRTQWVGLEGAPNTQSFTLDSPVGKNVGLGLSIVNDEIGPSEEQYVDLNFSYSIKASDTYKLSFGVKGGGRVINIDWSKGSFKDNDVQFQQNIQNKFLPVVGAGIYLHSEKSYLGLSVPNFLTDERYDEVQEGLADERMHLFLIGGWVFDLSPSVKFKPAFLTKYVSGAPVIVDLSANFMFNDKFRLGASYRTGDSFSALAGFQITPQFLIGYTYDYTTTELQKFSSGSHEIMLRFELKSKEKGLKSPRFF